MAEVGAHALIFQVSACAPVSSASATWHGDQVIHDPKDDDCAKVREWVVYRGPEQAADSNEKCDKNNMNLMRLCFLLQQT